MKRGCLVILSGLLTAAFRFLATRGFNNDHFVHLSAAQQMLFGDWPTRDFIDVGRPLTIVTSAIVQYLFGRTLLAEAVLVSVAFGVAAALTAVIVLELTNSMWIAAGAVVFEVIAFPRTYSYPKILVTAAALWCIGHFVRNPTRPRQVVLAVVTVIAFLFRHDLGLFVGIGGLVASIVATPAPASWQRRCRDAAIFAGLVAVLAAPYLLYVQLTDGVWNYTVTTLDANRAEAGYVWPSPFTADASSEARLLYVFHLLPAAVLALCIADARSDRVDWRTRFLVAVAVLGVAENFGLMRDLLKARVPDAIVPAVVAGAWLVWRGWAEGAAYVVVPTAVAVVAAGFLVADLGSFTDNLQRAGLSLDAILHPSRVLDQFSERSTMLRDRFAADPPSRVVMPLVPFFEYLDRCIPQQDRIFLAGMIPEVAYYARRPFAGGGYEHYNYSSDVNQKRVLNRLRREVTPFALIPSESEQEFDRDLPIVASYFRGRYVPLADVPVYEDRSVRILIDRTLPWTSRDRTTGWPCMSPQPAR